MDQKLHFISLFWCSFCKSHNATAFLRTWEHLNEFLLQTCTSSVTLTVTGANSAPATNTLFGGSVAPGINSFFGASGLGTNSLFGNSIFGNSFGNTNNYYCDYCGSGYYCFNGQCYATVDGGSGSSIVCLGTPLKTVLSDFFSSRVTVEFAKWTTVTKSFFPKLWRTLSRS